MPWRKLIQYIFKQYTDGMNFEKMLQEDFIRKIFQQIYFYIHIYTQNRNVYIYIYAVEK